MTTAPARTLPDIEAHTKAFWTGGKSDQLLINHCVSCQSYIHPPVPMCASCGSRDVTAKPVSGRAKVASFTVNHMRWLPELNVPYVFAIVELVEQAGLYVSTEIINIEPEKVAIGMDVCVAFEKQEDVYLPLFQPLD